METETIELLSRHLEQSAEKLIHQQEQFDEILRIVQTHIIERLPNADLPITTELDYVNKILAQYTESLLLLIKVKELINARKSE